MLDSVDDTMPSLDGVRNAVLANIKEFHELGGLVAAVSIPRLSTPLEHIAHMKPYPRRTTDSLFLAIAAVRSAAVTRTMTLVMASAAMCAVGDSLDDWKRMKPQVPRAYLAARAAEAPVIDGNPVESIWDSTPWTEDFVDIEGDARPVPRHRTRAKMLWDDEYLYVAAWLEEPNVWATIHDHDAVIYHDNDFEVFVDPDGDNHHYYELELNALNTGWDLFLSKPYKDGGAAEDAFELVGLRTAVTVQGTLNDPRDADEGWSLEIAIPWRAFDRPAGCTAGSPRAGDRWRVGFSRVQWQTKVTGGRIVKVPDRAENNWVWSAQGIVDMHRPERWGSVVFSGEASTVGLTPVLDPYQPERDLLMEVYHRQRSYHEKNGEWAADLEALGMDSAAWDSAGGVPAMARSAAGFTASIVIRRGGTEAGTWTVDQESRLSFAPGTFGCHSNPPANGSDAVGADGAHP